MKKKKTEKNVLYNLKKISKLTKQKQIDELTKKKSYI